MQRVRVGRIMLFLMLTFGLTWGSSLLTGATVGHDAYLEMGMAPLGMFFPAFVALFLQVFVFNDSPIYFRSYKGKPRLIFFSFFLLTLLHGGITVFALTTQVQLGILQGLDSWLIILWTLLVINLHRRYGEEEFRRAGLQLGNADQGLRLVLGVVLFLIVQATLNLVLGLGGFQGRANRIEGIPIPGSIYPLALIIFFLLAVTGTPLGGLAVVFGEEYAWRGFLQDELIKLGRRGVLLIGLVWGIWHFPIILSGIHTYPPTVAGLLMGLVFFGLWGVVQSYAVLKTGSIWVAVFLHGVVNSVYAFTLSYLVRPYDKVFSFGLGWFGLACLSVVVVFILRDSVWRNEVHMD